MAKFFIGLSLTLGATSCFAGIYLLLPDPSLDFLTNLMGVFSQVPPPLDTHAALLFDFIANGYYGKEYPREVVGTTLYLASLIIAAPGMYQLIHRRQTPLT